ncbi:MAG TPA: hypothetical protein VHX86_10470 [Tepidisphaeraceae bacterium]|jgi:hypothetical protein|nr:hypothetical protein [Tepidisphaeraceae bacterium]
MNPKYHGDSKDIFKRGFLDLLKNCPSLRPVKILPLFTGEYHEEDVVAYTRVLGVDMDDLISLDRFYPRQDRKKYLGRASLVAETCDVFMDPDRGIVQELRDQASDREVVSVGEIRTMLADAHGLFLAFDESLSNADRETGIGEKIDALTAMGMTAFAYFNSSPNQPSILIMGGEAGKHRVHALRPELLALGIPSQKIRPLF